MNQNVISHPYEFKLIPLSQIVVDRRYQRELVPRTIKNMTDEFDYHLVNPIKVTFRDGCYHAFDGQNTATGLRINFGDAYLAPCMVYYDVNEWIDEAEIFEDCNAKNASKALSASDMWKSKISRGEDKYVTIKNIAEKHGFQLAIGVTWKKEPGWIRALDALEYCFDILGGELFDEMMEIVASAWAYDPKSVQATLLRGVAIFIKTYNGDYDKTSLIEKLRKETPANILRAGKASAEGGNAKYAREILALYNSYRKRPLPYKFK